MDEQRKLRNLLAYTKTDTIEELEDCNKLYEELLAYKNKKEKNTELLELYMLLVELSEKYATEIGLLERQKIFDTIIELREEIYSKKEELGEMK